MKAAYDYSHYTNYGASIQPGCADAGGFLKFRVGFEKMDSEKWTASERWIAEMIESIDAWRDQ